MRVSRHVMFGSAACVGLVLGPALASPVPAFPGAEGFGAMATGGRGSADVYRVTSLLDTNTQGTLRHAISSAPSAGRTIVFDVSGVIQLSSNLSISKSNLTIAGQTAPGIGITVAGWQTSVTGSNVILRYMRFRPGDTNGPLKKPAANFQGDALSIGSSSGSYTNIIVDHVSTSWGIDENLSVSSGHNVTVQNSIIAEGLANAGHTNDAGTGIEEHSMGSLIRYGSGSVTFARNLFLSNTTRNPRVGDNVKLDFVNNVLYNWAGQPAYSGGASEGQTVVNWRGNYSIAGPETASSTNRNRTFVGGSLNTTLYQSANRIDPDRDGVLDGVDTGWAMFTGTYTKGTGTFPAAAVPVTMEDAADAYRRVLADAGMSNVRDSVDVRQVDTLRVQPGMNGAIIDSQDAVGGWDATPGESRPAGWDTDGDGMPNYWEETFGFNPGVKDNHLVQWSGYTALEHYLYWLVPSIPGDANGDMVLGADDYALVDRGMAMGLGGWRGGDFNYDGEVDAADYLILDRGVAGVAGLSAEVLAERERRFGSAYAEALVASVPEPGGAAAVLAAGAALVVGRRRHGRDARATTVQRGLAR